jgi:Na+-driven multidrug efflux pump
LVYFFAHGMLRAMQLPGGLMDYALPFLTLMGATLFMESMNISIAAVLRAHGHTRDAMLFSFSIGLGTEILIGHLVGAGQFEEAYHKLLGSLRTGLIIVSCVMLVVAVFAPLLLGIFTRNAAIVAGGAVLLRLAIVLEPGRVFNVVDISSLRATGDVGFPIQMAVLSM